MMLAQHCELMLGQCWAGGHFNVGPTSPNDVGPTLGIDVGPTSPNDVGPTLGIDIGPTSQNVVGPMLGWRTF